MMMSQLSAPCYGLLASLLIITSNGQQCSEITQGDLGTTAAPSTSGLISSALSLGIENAHNPLVQLFEYHVVCEVVAPTRDTYRYTSVITNFTADGVFRTTQFDFGCTERNEWDIVVAGSSDSIVTDPPDGSFDTTPRSDCGVCISPRRLSASDTETHCVREFV